MRLAKVERKMCRNLGENVWCSFKLRKKSNSGAHYNGGKTGLVRDSVKLVFFLELLPLTFYGAG